MGDRVQPSDTVHLGGLSEAVTEDVLVLLCSRVGTIQSVRLVQDQGRGGKYAFCKFKDVESAIYAWAVFRGALKLYGRPVTVGFSKQPYGEALSPLAEQLLERGLALHNLRNSASRSGPASISTPLSAGHLQDYNHSTPGDRGHHGLHSGSAGNTPLSDQGHRAPYSAPPLRHAPSAPAPTTLNGRFW